MTPDERQLLSELFERVRSAAGNKRDSDAEAFIADQVRAQPYAPYLLAQAVIVQEEGLRNAAQRIEELERQLRDAQPQPQAQSGGGFLGSIFGGGSRPQGAPQPQGSGPWGGQRGSVPSSGSYGGQEQPQGGPWNRGGMNGPMGGPMGGQMGGLAQQGPQGGSFLRGALGAAAGVAGGMLLANSLSGLFKGESNSHGIASGTGAESGDKSSLASNDDSGIAGGVFDNRSSDAGSQDSGYTPASYDQDDGGWGGGDDSYDA